MLATRVSDDRSRAGLDDISTGRRADAGSDARSALENRLLKHVRTCESTRGRRNNGTRTSGRLDFDVTSRHRDDGRGPSWCVSVRFVDRRGMDFVCIRPTTVVERPHARSCVPSTEYGRSEIINMLSRPRTTQKPCRVRDREGANQPCRFFAQDPTRPRYTPVF